MYKNWKPDNKWTHRANDMLKFEGNSWAQAAELLRTTAGECKEKNKKGKDKELQDMLATVGVTPPEERKALYKRIWRRRRHLKRQKHAEDLQEAAGAGRAPPGPRPSSHLNWGKIVGNRASSRRRSSPTTSRSSTGFRGTRPTRRRRCARASWTNGRRGVWT